MNDVNYTFNSITLPDICSTTFIQLIQHLMQTNELEKSKSHILVDIVDYVPDSVVAKTILQKTTGTVTISAIDAGEILEEKILPYDTFIQIIEGAAEVIIDDTRNVLKTGEGIIIPAHTPNNIKANQRFKMISTIVKSGYEAFSI